MKQRRLLGLVLALLLIFSAMPLTAKAASFTVTFDFNGHDVEPFLLEVEEGETIKEALLAYKAETGVDPWTIIFPSGLQNLYYDRLGGKHCSFEDPVLAGDLTIYAHWYMTPDPDGPRSNVTVDMGGYADNVVLSDVQYGTNLAELLFFTEMEFPVVEGLEPTGFGLKPFSEFTDKEDYDYWNNVFFNMYVTEDITVYLHMSQLIYQIEATIDYPVAGTVVEAPDYVSGFFGWDTQTNKPNIILPEGVHYHMKEGASYWVADESGEIPFIGTLVAGESYLAEFYLHPDMGYTYAQGCEFHLENGEVVDYNIYNNLFCLARVEVPYPFADVKIDKGWEYPYVKYVYENGYMTGKGTNGAGEIIFDPDMELTRAELVQTLYGMAGKPEVEFVPEFADVKESDWFASAVTWASENGIVKGKGEGRFDPVGKATREEAVTMLFAFVGSMELPLEGIDDLDEFSDVDEISSWAVEKMEWAVGHGLIAGKDDKLDPRGTTRRSEWAAMLKAFDEQFK